MAPRRSGRLRRGARRAGHLARRGAHHARRGISHVGVAPIGILLGAVAAGWAEQKGYLAKLPKIGNSGAITLVVAGYVTQRFLKNRMAKSAGYAMMAAGGFGFGKEQAGGTSGLDEHSEFGEHNT